MEQEKPKYPKYLLKHIVQCPHCGADALDHMTSCPKCKGELEPRGYSPIIATPTQKRIKKILSIILYGILAVLLIIVLYERFFS
ncbi:MAG TPA: hypothetical protein GXZ61_03900 [Clostridiales bacterium]|jgi:uncharacterized membrane protein YvbJ|nr:hypothetical protein [Clostridiales bacterium]